MRIALVGAGNVANCMAGALVEAGHDIVCVFSRTMEHAVSLAGRVNAVPVTSFDALEDADVYISMLTDDALLSCAGKMVRQHPTSLFLHTSGSIPLSVWTDAGASRCGVLYPMQTFSRGKQVDWKAVPVFIEASTHQDCETVQRIASSLSGNVTYLDSEKRGLLHLAAVFACNFTNRMYAISAGLLERCGIPFGVMQPLIDETCAKAAVIPPSEGQTGPAVRGDRRVMDMHLELLEGTPEWRRLYELISEDIIRNRNGRKN